LGGCSESAMSPHKPQSLCTCRLDAPRAPAGGAAPLIYIIRRVGWLPTDLEARYFARLLKMHVDLEANLALTYNRHSVAHAAAITIAML